MRPPVTGFCPSHLVSQPPLHCSLCPNLTPCRAETDRIASSVPLVTDTRVVSVSGSA